jgi:hypothetical protein
MHRTQSDTKTVKAQRESVQAKQHRVDPQAGYDRWLVQGLAKIYQETRKRLAQNKDEGLTVAKWQIIKEAHLQAEMLKAEAEKRQKETERIERKRKRGEDFDKMLRTSNIGWLPHINWMQWLEARLERDYNIKIRINEKTGEIEGIDDVENGQRTNNGTPEPKDAPFK